MAERSQAQPLNETLRLAASGDEGAWRTLVSSYSRRVFGLLVKQCGDRELAEELTQATFVKVVRKLGDFAGYEERGKFEPWLFRIAMNKLRDEMRRRGRQAVTMDMSPGATSGSDTPSGWAAAEQEAAASEFGPTSTDSPLDQVERAEQVELLQAAIARLGDADQEILHLRHTAGMSFAEIAETLEQPLGTVLARGHRALGKLRKLLADDEELAQHEKRKKRGKK